MVCWLQRCRIDGRGFCGHMPGVGMESHLHVYLGSIYLIDVVQIPPDTTVVRW